MQTGATRMRFQWFVVAMITHGGCFTALRLRENPKCHPKYVNKISLDLQTSSWQPLAAGLHAAEQKSKTPFKVQNPRISSHFKVYVPDAPFLQALREDALNVNVNTLWTEFLSDIAIHEVLLASANRVGSMAEADIIFVPWYSRFAQKFCEPEGLAESTHFAKQVIHEAGDRHVFIIHSSTQPIKRLGGEGLTNLLSKPNVHVGAVEMRDKRGGAYVPNLNKDLAVPYFIPNIFVADSLARSGNTSPASKKYFVHMRATLRNGGSEREKIMKAFMNKQFGNVSRDFGENSSPTEEMQLMQESIFCLVPGGITPTSRRLFESILNECIPVLASPDNVVPFQHIVKPEEFMVVWDGHESYEALAQRVYAMSTKQIFDKWTKLKQVKTHFIFEMPGVFQGPGAVDAILSGLETMTSPKKSALHSSLEAMTSRKKKSALAMVCFRNPHGYSRHKLGCLLTALSFMAASPDADLIIVTPNDEWVPDDLRKIAEKDSRVKIAAVGEGPYSVGDRSVPLFGSKDCVNAEICFTGNGLRQVWLADKLKKHMHDYQNVGIVDGADILFQTNPFDMMKENPAAHLFFFGDRGDDHNEGQRYFDERTTTLGSPYSNKEFKERVKAAFYNEEEKYSVYANGGAMFGKLQAVLDIQSKMVQITVVAEYWHSDQGQMNIARYLYGEKNGMDKVVCYPDYARSITMGHTKTWSKFTSEGLLASEKGQPFIFIHQYDKSDKGLQEKEITQLISKLIQPMLNKYGLPMPKMH